MSTTIKLDGYGLKSSDVAAIVDIVNALNAGAPPSGVSSVGATLPLASSGGATPVLSMPGLAAFPAVGQSIRTAAAGNAWEAYTPASPSGSPAPVVLTGAGPHTLTHAAHANRGVSIAEVGPSVDILFQNLAADADLEDQDFFTIYNEGPGILLLKGTIVDRSGMKRFILPGETAEVLYNAALDTNITQTRHRRLTGGLTPSFQAAALPNSATISSIGVQHTAVDSSIAAIVAPSSATPYANVLKNRYAGQAAGVNRSAGLVTTQAAFFVPTPATPIEWAWRGYGAVVDAIADGRMFLGLGTALAFTAEPTTMLNCFGFASDSDMGQLVLVFNDGAGVCDEVVLNGGAGFPSQTNGVDMYRAYFYAFSNGTKAYIYWSLRNIVTGVEVNGVKDFADANMPAANIPLTVQMWRNSGPTTAATSLFHFGGSFGGTQA